MVIISVQLDPARVNPTGQEYEIVAEVVIVVMQLLLARVPPDGHEKLETVAELVLVHVLPERVPPVGQE